jgi:hypothetical protein
MFHSYINFVVENIDKKKYNEIIDINNFIIGDKKLIGGVKSQEELEQIKKKSQDFIINLKKILKSNNDDLTELIRYIDALYMASYVFDLTKVNNSITEVIDKLDNELKETT